MNAGMLFIVTQAILDILARHAASGNTEPLTDVQVHALLLSDLQDGQSAIALEFASKGWELPK